MAESHLTEIPARSGAAIELAAGEAIRLVNSFGNQVVDTWALNRRDITRISLGRAHAPHAVQSLSPRGRQALQQSANADAAARAGFLRRAARHALRLLRPLALSALRLRRGPCELPRQLPRRTRARSASRRPHVPNPLNLWMNIPVSGEQQARDRTAREPRRRLCGAAGSDRLHRHLLRLPHGRHPHQRPRLHAEARPLRAAAGEVAGGRSCRRGRGGLVPRPAWLGGELHSHNPHGRVGHDEPTETCLSLLT